MHKILNKKKLNENIYEIEVLAPYVVRNATAGQFVILRLNEKGERFPLTLVRWDKEKKSIVLIFQVAGKSTEELSKLNINDYISDIAGPLGKPNDMNIYGKNILAIGGGVGLASLFSEVKELYELGKNIDVIMGTRSKDYLILYEEFKKISNNVYIISNDGSIGEKGLVTDIEEKLLEKNTYNNIISIGPVLMMEATTKIAKKYNIPINVSLNPIMVDGTGMCGGCRVKIGDKTMFACVDGPNFDGYLVDFGSLNRRNNMYKKNHKCKLIKK